MKPKSNFCKREHDKNIVGVYKETSGSFTRKQSKKDACVKYYTINKEHIVKRMREWVK
jgi:hypothetical protein